MTISAPCGRLTLTNVCGGLRRMDPTAEEFSRLVGTVVNRFFEQNGQPPPSPGAVGEFGFRLWGLLLERSLARPMGKFIPGMPAGMSEEELAPLISRALGESGNPWLVLAGKQIVKACVYPELKACRNSWSEVDSAGTCRRQELGRARQRVSGTHCIDCPHWVALAPARHATFLSREWRGGPSEFERGRAVFLPEDFRHLRLWLQARAGYVPT